MKAVLPLSAALAASGSAALAAEHPGLLKQLEAGVTCFCEAGNKHALAPVHIYLGDPREEWSC